MADRVTKVRLLAEVSNYLAGMRQAQQETAKTATASQQLANQRQGMETLGRSMLAVGAAAATLVGVAVAKFAEFDKAMSGVQAATHESTANMELLREAALSAGEATVYSASESATAVENLAKAGVSTADILSGGLSGALDLAAAGEVEVGTAAELAASALTQFGLAGSDIPHVADLLAAGAGKAQGSVEDMGQALNQSGLVAAQMGLSIEETTGTLAAFASAGLIGSDAGTSFRAMLLRLANPTDEAKAKLQELGISAYDAQGNFVGIESLAGQLETRMGSLSQEERNAALALIFGQDAIRSSSILYEMGAKGVAQWVENVDDSGYAAETAALRMDNLAGDIEKLGGALDSAAIKAGEAANGPFRFLVQAATNLVDGFNSAPPVVQQVTLGVAALTAAVGLAGGAFVLGVPKVAAYKASLEALNLTGSTSVKVMGLVGKAVGGLAIVGTAVAAVSALADAFGANGLAAEEFTAQVASATTQLQVFATLQADLGNRTSFGTGGPGPIDVQNFQGRLDEIATAQEGYWQRLAAPPGANALEESLASFGTELAALPLNEGQLLFEKLAGATDGTQESLTFLLSTMPDYRASLIEQLKASGDTVSQQNILNMALGRGEYDTLLLEKATKEQTAALQGMEPAAAGAADEVSNLADQIRGLAGITLDQRAANRQFEQSVDDVRKALRQEGASLNDSTQAGRDTTAAIDDLAKSTLEAAASTYEMTGSVQESKQQIREGRNALIAQLQAFGLSKAAARDYADELGLIPANITSVLSLDTSGAAAAIRNLSIENLAPWERKGVYASGGTVGGVGTSKSDSNLILASRGEEVIQEPYASRNRGLLKYLNSGGDPTVYQRDSFTYSTTLAPEITIVQNNPVARDPGQAAREGGQLALAAAGI